MPGFVLVAEAREASAVSAHAVGFVHVLEIDGHAHLEQLSVLPSFGRRGIGRRLVQAALSETRSRGHQTITLRTYRDVPWNAPFYASCGFTVTEPDSTLLRSLVDTETALGLFRYGPRVQMSATL
ncbi:GNAT family N-acetyltransferase [Microbacterium oxydans]|uniref:GNAT family N-acetyltransferase n=1 Tax=Microbacterium oxydans TaxID=82380 RepID=UPI003266B83B